VNGGGDEFLRLRVREGERVKERETGFFLLK